MLMLLSACQSSSVTRGRVFYFAVTTLLHCKSCLINEIAEMKHFQNLFQFITYKRPSWMSSLFLLFTLCLSGHTDLHLSTQSVLDM